MIAVYRRTGLTNSIAWQLRVRKRAREGMLNYNRISMMTSAESLSSWLVGDGHANVLTIVERAADFESRFIQGSVGVRLRPAWMLHERRFETKQRRKTRSYLHKLQIVWSSVTVWQSHLCSAVPVDDDGKVNSEDTGIHAQQPINLLRATR